MNTSEVLNKAADLIEERGWQPGCGGWPGDPQHNGTFCLEGALMAVLGYRVDQYSSRPDEFVNCPAYSAMATYLDTKLYSVFTFNDEQTDAAPVIEALRAAALIEEAKEYRERTEARLWEKVDKTGECWVFTGCLNKGYGSLFVDGQARLAHRLSYEFLVGPIPDGLVLDHLCRNTVCVNPDHLEPVTVAENNRRGEGGWNVTNGDTCRHGLHPWPESRREFGDGSSRCQPCHEIRIKRRSAKRSAERAAAKESAAVQVPAEVVA